MVTTRLARTGQVRARYVRTGRGVVVALAVVGLLAGCGRSTSTSATGSASGALKAGPATGTLTVWAQGAEAEGLPELLRGFEAANPGVKVSVTAVPWSQAHDKYQAAIAAGTTPDVGQLGTTWMAEFAPTGALDATPKDIDTSGFYPGSVASTKVGGGTYGVPWYVDTPVLYYRTDLAAKAGITTPPADWTQLKATARALQAKGGAKFGIALPPKDFQAFLPFAWSNGARLTSDGDTAWTIDTPQLVEAVRYYQSFFTEGIANRTPSIDTGAVEANFVSGAVPMFIGGPFEVATLNKLGGAGFPAKYATAVLPKKVTSTSFVGGSDLAVFKASKNRDAAWKLVQYLVRPETQVAWYARTGDLPSVRAAWQRPPLAGDPKLAVFGRQLEHVASPPALTKWAEVAGAGDTTMERVTVSGLDPAAAMSQLQASANSIGTRG